MLSAEFWPFMGNYSGIVKQSVTTTAEPGECSGSVVV